MINLLPTPKICRENEGKAIIVSPVITSESKDLSQHIPVFSKIFESFSR